MMNRKILMVSAVLGAVLTACLAYLVLPRSLKLVCVLDATHLAAIRPDGTLADMTCPYEGSKLTRIVVVEEAGGADMPWRAAYVCETESIFWVFDYRGGVGKVEWYGPFDGTWDATNMFAAIVAAIAGTALAAVLVKAVHL